MSTYLDFNKTFCFVTNFKDETKIIDFFGWGLFEFYKPVDIYDADSLDDVRAMMGPVDDMETSGTVFAQNYETVLNSDHECQASYNGSKISTAFSHKIKEKDLTLEIIADDKNQFNFITDSITLWSNNCIAKKEPGIFVYKGWYRRGYMFGCENSEFDEHMYSIVKNYKIIFTDQKWTRLIYKNISTTTGNTVTTGWDPKSFDGSYDFSILADSVINNNVDLLSGDYDKLKIGGYESAHLVIKFKKYVNPFANLDKNFYTCCMLVEDAEDKTTNPRFIAYGTNQMQNSDQVTTVTVNTRERTILDNNGNDLFYQKFDGSFPFKKLENYKVYSMLVPVLQNSGTTIEVMILEERDEPETWI